jgi:putative ABC transport system permease protein
MPKRSRMSLVLILAKRNLFQDKLRFVASLTGIVFSVVLVMVQMGLYLGFSRMVTTVIDHTSTDLWVVSSGAKYFEDLSLLPTTMRERLAGTEGVTEVTPVVAGFSAWRLPDGAMTSVFIVGTDVTARALRPWNVVEGDIQSLTASGTVAIDRSYFERLGASGVGTTSQIRALPVKVGAVTAGIRSFTTTPYVFTNVTGARSYIGLPTGFTTHFLLKVQREADIGKISQHVLSNNSAVQVLTSDQFRDQSRSFWLFRTGAGAALVAGALLGVIVGTVIVAQTLYSSTKEHLYEFATLRAMGASDGYIYKVIICQALLNAILGYAIASLVGVAVAHFTVDSAVQIVVTPALLAALLVLTILMCIGAAVAAIVRVIRVDPATVLTR